jgi:hypothetical protein
VTADKGSPDEPVKKRNESDSLVERFSGGGQTYPTPLAQVPPEVMALWSSGRTRRSVASRGVASVAAGR